MSTLTPCSYDRLAVGVAYHSGQTLDDLPEPCPEPAAYYVSVVQADDHYVVEHLTSVCVEHDARVRTATGYQWSRLRRNRPRPPRLVA
jgi:hypothetical protein